jgi:HEAT repeat protein
MNTLIRLMTVLSVFLLATGFLAGCSKEPSKPDVDVNAQIQALKSSDANARAGACTALAASGPKSAAAVPALTEALKDSDPLVRRLAAYALMEIGPEHAKSAVPAVGPLLRDPDRDVQQQAVNTLRILDPENAGQMQNVNVQSGPPPANP